MHVIIVLKQNDDDMNHFDIFSSYAATLKDIFTNQEIIKKQQEKILRILENYQDSKKLKDYISENDAKKLLNRKTTWFWNLRNEGLIPYSKVGNQVWYKLKDIEAFLEKNQK